MGLDIQAIIIAAVALLGSTGGVTAIFAGFLKKFKALKEQLREMAEAKELKSALIDAHSENVQLKKTIIKLMEKLDNMHYTDDEFIDQQVTEVLEDAGINVDELMK